MLGVVGVLAACGGNTTEGGAQGNGQEGQRTELRLAIGGASEEGYDPTLGWGRYGSPLFQSTLLTREDDLGFGYDLATSYDVSNGGKTWTVDIREDAVFTDGEPVTAEDVAYTYTTAAEQGGLTDVTGLDKVEATGEHTVEFTLTTPRSTFVNRLATLGIVPEHAHDEDYALHPIGSGPFTFVDWQRGQQLVVERNDDYYGDKPSFERITFVFTGEDASLAAMRTGDVDLAGVPSTLATQEIDGARVVAVTSVDNRGISMPYTEDGLPLRRALNVAVDREALVEGVLEGFGTPAYGPADATPWAAEGLEVDDADPDAARQILTDAGWRDEDGDGFLDDAQLTLFYPADDSLRRGLALNVADQAKDAGIEIDAKGASWEVIEERMHDDAVVFGWGSLDPTEIYNLYHSEEAGQGFNNPGGYANPQVDEHLDAAVQTADPDRARGQWQQAQKAAAEDVPWIWLVNLEHTYYVADCLDVGTPQVEPHGHGWPITAGIADWTWTC